MEASFLGHCEVGQALATRLGFGQGVIHALGQLYGRWGGKGVPDVSPVSMCVALAQDVLVHLRLGGDADAALTVVCGRSGRAYRPDLVEALNGSMLAGLGVAPTWAEMIELEPGSPRWSEGTALDEAFAAIGDFTDIKSPWRLGHSSAVAMLAGAAAERGGLSAGDMVDVRFAGFVHDLGTIGVSAGTWGQPSPLTETQRDQVHLHAYHSERIIGRVSHLAGIAVIVGGHHERADGSGYHRATPHPGPSTQLLAAADVYVALAADRPYRPRRSADEAASALRDEAQMGRLDSDVVARVIDAAHGTTTANKVLVTRLTDREIEVLRLLARGSRTK